MLHIASFKCYEIYHFIVSLYAARAQSELRIYETVTLNVICLFLLTTIVYILFWCERSQVRFPALASILLYKLKRCIKHEWCKQCIYVCVFFCWCSVVFCFVQNTLYVMKFCISNSNDNSLSIHVFNIVQIVLMIIKKQP